MECQADPRGFLKTPGSMRAYIRGAFLCTGSMSDPGKSYHFEMVCEDEQTAQILKELMAGFFCACEGDFTQTAVYRVSEGQ